jgi:hypothetical protein
VLWLFNTALVAIAGFCKVLCSGVGALVDRFANEEEEEMFWVA